MTTFIFLYVLKYIIFYNHLKLPYYALFSHSLTVGSLGYFHPPVKTKRSLEGFSSLVEASLN